MVHSENTLMLFARVVSFTAQTCVIVKLVEIIVHYCTTYFFLVEYFVWDLTVLLT